MEQTYWARNVKGRHEGSLEDPAVDMAALPGNPRSLQSFGDLFEVP